jgi:hypothetical protein
MIHLKLRMMTALQPAEIYGRTVAGLSVTTFTGEMKCVSEHNAVPL